MIQLIERNDASMAVLVPIGIREGVRDAIKHSVRFMGARPGKWGVYARHGSRAAMVIFAERNSSEELRIKELGFKEYCLDPRATVPDMIKTATKIARSRKFN